jgi:hypothetical protein
MNSTFAARNLTIDSLRFELDSLNSTLTERDSTIDSLRSEIDRLNSTAMDRESTTESTRTPKRDASTETIDLTPNFTSEKEEQSRMYKRRLEIIKTTLQSTIVDMQTTHRLAVQQLRQDHLLQLHHLKQQQTQQPQ